MMTLREGRTRGGEQNGGVLVGRRVVLTLVGDGSGREETEERLFGVFSIAASSSCSSTPS
jgi:hypothetical protein